MTDIKELKDGMRKVDATGVIRSKGDSRTVNLKTGGTAVVCEYVLGDASGEVKLVLWDGDIDKVAENSIIHVTNGFVSQYRGEAKLNVGKYGQLTVDS